ncbi:MAG: DUF4956 domain-containing protein [Bacteroidales bacterium]|nr:DUF4956 domain-containing protein [Bacteroidales bacterium]
MLDDFQNLDLFPVTIFEIITNLIVALICGLIISVVYRFVYKGANYSVSYVNSLILLTLITSVVILVIGNNLARAFGLVGAMSIIRFRTAVRDVSDIVFIFLALTIGMAAGVGLHLVAIISTLVICLIIITLDVFNFGNPRKRGHLLQISYNATHENEIKLGSIINKHCRRLKLINIKNIGKDNDMEVYYQITLKGKSKGTELIRDLKSFEDIYDINLYFDEDDTNPPVY